MAQKPQSNLATGAAQFSTSSHDASGYLDELRKSFFSLFHDRTQPTSKKHSVKSNAAYDLKVTQLVHNTNLDIYKRARLTRRSGVVCTIGPASKSVEMLTKLMTAGLNVVRLNFSHGTHDYHASTIENARNAALHLGRDICVALDTKGPEIRTGNFVGGKEVILELG